jgi:hypothetical protein
VVPFELMFWRRVGGADLQELRHQRRVIGDPVAHHDPATGPGHANDLLDYVRALASLFAARHGLIAVGDASSA